ncbi:universal stress protein [Cardiobacteriaceae bacterium TAE3-ERU3]|nr:universal stress protein [Cardiobacteriaceae bacterium TAE3-ERU3]
MPNSSHMGKTIILLPVDLSDPVREERSVQEAIRQAEAFNGEIHLIAVVPEFSGYLFKSLYDDSVGKQAEVCVRDRLETFCADYMPQSVPHTLHIGHGTVYKAILDTAERIAADLIVMSASRPELADYLLGPNTAKVVRHSRRSVLVVRNEFC